MKWSAIGIGFCVFLLDLFSKHWIVDNLPVNGSISVFENYHGIDFSIFHATNRGAAWSAFSSFPNALLVFRIAIALILFALFFFGRISKKACIPFALILSGAIGNILDFFLYGHVVDFIAFKFWGYLYPIFNVADSTIFCGVALLMLQWIRDKRYSLN